MAEGETTRQDDAETFRAVLGRAVDAIEGADIPYAVFGSIASALYGRPGRQGDIDFLVRPGESEQALEALAAGGFDTDRTDPKWIFKATLDGVLVDVIFQVRGGIYLDDEMIERIRPGEFDGQKLRLISPEDTMVIEAVGHEDQAPDHWYNAVSIISSADLDWDYVVSRARHSTRRILSLLIYAESEDRVVPGEVIKTLYEQAYPA